MIVDVWEKRAAGQKDQVSEVFTVRILCSVSDCFEWVYSWWNRILDKWSEDPDFSEHTLYIIIKFMCSNYFGSA